MKINRLLALLAVALLIAGCDIASPSSAWGEITTVAQAEQLNPPALALSGGTVVSAWIGADERGVHQDARLISSGDLGDVVTLPLPPRQPRAQTLLPAAFSSAHLLWLDANDDGEPQLFAAFVDLSDLTVVRGPVPVSEDLTLRYAAIARADDVLVAWSGGLPGEPTLTLRRLDGDGRPTDLLDAVGSADYPFWLQTDAGLQLFWLGTHDFMLHGTPLTNDRLGAPLTIAPSVYLGQGDRLLDLKAGADRHYTYVFWNIARANGTFETWFSAGANGVWAQPTRLGIALDSSTQIETGYNGGRASAAQLGEQYVSLSAPLAAQAEVLPVAAQSADGLIVIYFRDGTVVGTQTIDANVRLLAPPLILSDRNRDLYVTWSQPTAAGYAELKLVTTRR